MTTFKNGIIIGTLCLAISACTTVPDPAEVCSAEWIKPRAERAMSDFKKDTRPIFRKLKKSAKSLDNGKSLGPLQMLSLMNSINKLANKVENGRAIGDLRTLANTCDDPKLIQEAMTDFMRGQGINEKFISFLNTLPPYLEMLDTGKRPDVKI